MTTKPAAIKPRAKEQFGAWYNKNAERLAERRKLKYATDEEYRNKAKARAELQREALKAARPVLTDGMVKMKDVCQTLNVGAWTLSNWKHLGYYPQPAKFQGSPVFTEKQVDLLKTIKQFFLDHPTRSAGDHRGELEVITATVHNNWT